MPCQKEAARRRQFKQEQGKRPKTSKEFPQAAPRYRRGRHLSATGWYPDVPCQGAEHNGALPRPTG